MTLVVYKLYMLRNPALHCIALPRRPCLHCSRDYHSRSYACLYKFRPHSWLRECHFLFSFCSARPAHHFRPRIILLAYRPSLSRLRSSSSLYLVFRRSRLSSAFFSCSQCRLQNTTALTIVELTSSIAKLDAVLYINCK